MANAFGGTVAESTDSVMVTDDEIQRIVEENSPGVVDVLRAFEDAEVAYGSVASAPLQVTSGSYTTAL